MKLSQIVKTKIVTRQTSKEPEAHYSWTNRDGKKKCVLAIVFNHALLTAARYRDGDKVDPEIIQNKDGNLYLHIKFGSEGRTVCKKNNGHKKTFSGQVAYAHESAREDLGRFFPETYKKIKVTDIETGGFVCDLGITKPNNHKTK